MKEKTGTYITVSEGSCIILMITVLCLILGVGYMFNRKEHKTVFNSADIERIEQAQKMYEEDVEVYKEKDGSLVIKLSSKKD